MKTIEEKIKALLEERENVVNEMNEIQKAYNIRQQRVIEINGGIKTLQELINDNKEESTENTTE